jgi:NitT/TauT family transport system substrate-binding protein
MRHLIGRRGVLAGAAALAAAPARSQDLRKVNFTLSWLADGYSGYAFAAVPFWRARGLDVTVHLGHGSVTAAQAIAAGQFDFGLSNATVVMQLATKDLWLRALSMISYETSMGVAVAAESAIQKPTDLEGKKVALAVTSSDAAFFKPFCQLNKVDYDKVHVLDMDALVRDRALTTGQVDAISGFASSFLAAFLTQNRKLRIMMYSHYGLPVYGDATLLTTEATAAKDPELCQAMADGLMEGLKQSLLQPDVAQAAFMQANPLLKLTANGNDFIRYGMAVQRANAMASDDPLQHGMGYMDTQRLQQSAEIVIRYMTPDGTKVPDATRIFRNDHAGHIKISDAEWKQAEANTAFIKPYLGA